MNRRVHHGSGEDMNEGEEYDQEGGREDGRHPSDEANIGSGNSGGDQDDNNPNIDDEEQLPQTHQSLSPQQTQNPARTNKREGRTHPLKYSDRLPAFNIVPFMRGTYRELRHFVLNPCPSPDHIMRCYIERQRSGLKMLAPEYSLCADFEDGTGRELLICRKVWHWGASHYEFYLKIELPDQPPGRPGRNEVLLGSLRRTGRYQYTLFDTGTIDPPEEDEAVIAFAEQSSAPDSRVPIIDAAAHPWHRHELCVIVFNDMLRPCRLGMRGMEVAIPNVMNSKADSADSDTDTSAAISTGIISSATVPRQAILQSIQASADSNSSPRSGEGAAQSASATAAESAPAKPPLGPAVSLFNLSKPFQTIRIQGRQNDLYSKSILCLNEKTFKFDPMSTCLVNLQGRALVASVRNHQLLISTPRQNFLGCRAAHEQMMASDDERDVVFQLGKITYNCFNMDFRYPLSMFQAFAVSIARFDAKLKFVYE